jgi:hypothetical protein
VEQALAGDRELARQSDLVREELVETIHLNETLRPPSGRAMERLFAAIDAEEARAPRHCRWFDLGSRISEFLWSLTPRTLAWSATAAAVAILVQVAVIAAVVVKEQGSPRGPALASAPSEGSYAVVRFAPQATANDIANFLGAHKATVVEDRWQASFTASASPRPSCRRKRSVRSLGKCNRNRRLSTSSPRKSKAQAGNSQPAR